jgi:Mg2+ and Co2+ transporter CorA
MRRDTIVAITIFLMVMLAIAVLAYFGWDRWSVEP